MDGTRLPEQQTQFGERRGSGLESKSKRPLHNTAMLIQQDSGRLLTIKQVAELLQVPQSWVYGRTRARDRYRLPGMRLGKYWRFRESDILAWLETQKS
jgi:excisionase family DNA binding protein